MVCLHLLHDALCLPAVESIYKSALHHIASQAETRKLIVYEDIQQQSFSQVRTSLSIFNCNLIILSSHMAIVGPGDVLKTLKDVCLRFINSTSEEYDHKLDVALTKGHRVELCNALLLDRFKSERDRLMSQVNEKFKQAVLKCKTSLKDFDFASSHGPLKNSTNSEVTHLTAHLQPVQQLRKHVFTLKSQIPSLCMIMSLNPSDLFPQSKDRQPTETRSFCRSR
jgi:hypothetical protein